MKHPEEQAKRSLSFPPGQQSQSLGEQSQPLGEQSQPLGERSKSIAGASTAESLQEVIPVQEMVEVELTTTPLPSETLPAASPHTPPTLPDSQRLPPPLNYLTETVSFQLLVFITLLVCSIDLLILLVISFYSNQYLLPVASVFHVSFFKDEKLWNPIFINTYRARGIQIDEMIKEARNRAAYIAKRDEALAKARAEAERLRVVREERDQRKKKRLVSHV